MLFLILFSGEQAEVTGSALQPAAASSNSALLSNPHAGNPLDKLAVTITPTASPEPDSSGAEQTGGIILAAALVVLVIVGGTLFSISRKK